MCRCIITTGIYRYLRAFIVFMVMKIFGGTDINSNKWCMIVCLITHIFAHLLLRLYLSVSTAASIIRIQHFINKVKWFICWHSTKINKDFFIMNLFSYLWNRTKMFCVLFCSFHLPCSSWIEPQTISWSAPTLERQLCSSQSRIVSPCIVSEWVGGLCATCVCLACLAERWVINLPWLMMSISIQHVAGETYV